MTVRVEREDQKDPASNVWFTALLDGRAELGAHVPADARRDDPRLSIFWCGDTSRSHFRNAVERAEMLFLKNGGYVRGTLYAYGPSKKTVGPITRTVQSSDPGLGQRLSQRDPLGWFSAYRAEFEGSGGQVVLWANVVDLCSSELEKGGDNIGICTSPTLFDGPVRTLIVDMIEETRRGWRLATRVLNREIVNGLLNEIAQEVGFVSPNLKK